MNDIESSMDKISDNALFKKKEQKRAELNQEKENLEYELQDSKFSESEFEKVYSQAKMVIINPVFLWELEDIEIKQLLIRVCFNNKIYYTKKQGLHTPEISLIYSVFSKLSNNNNPNLDQIVFLLNQNNYNIESFKADVEKVCIFWISLLKQWNLDKYSNYDYLLSEYGVWTINK